MTKFTGQLIKINNKEYELDSQLDFLDLGGGTGGSFEMVKKKFICDRGLAIDVEKKKIQEAIANGIPAIQLDASNLSIFQNNACKFISMVHMLEHLPSVGLASSVLKESIRVASDFLFIRGPMFYSNYLSKHGFKFYWSDWRGHTLMIEPDEILKIIHQSSKIASSEISYIKQVESSSNECIHPLGSKRDRHQYDSSIDPPKAMGFIFDKPLYKEFELIVKLNKSDQG